MDESDIKKESSKSKMQSLKFKSTNVATNKELIEYIDHVNGEVTKFYEVIARDTRQALTSTKLNTMQRSYLEWSLAHLHAELVKVHETLKNMQRSLDENR